MDFLKNLPLVRAGMPAHPGTSAHQGGPGAGGRGRPRTPGGLGASGQAFSAT